MNNEEVHSAINNEEIHSAINDEEVHSAINNEEVQCEMNHMTIGKQEDHVGVPWKKGKHVRNELILKSFSIISGLSVSVTAPLGPNLNLIMHSLMHASKFCEKNLR